MAEGDKIIDKVRLGTISATIWEQPYGYHKATLEYNHRDMEGNWQTLQEFGMDDLVLVSKVAEMAVNRMMELRAQEHIEQDQEQKYAWEEAYQQKLAHQHKQSM